MPVTTDYVASAARHADTRNQPSSSDGVVDIDEALDNTNLSGDDSFQFSTTESYQRQGQDVFQHTEQMVSNLVTGENRTREFSAEKTLEDGIGSPDRVTAESITTRTGSYHQDKVTGERSAHMESSTLATSHSLSTAGGEEGALTASITTSRKESSMSVRKESVINNSSTTNVLHTESSEPVPEEAAKEDGLVEGEIVSSQTVTSKSRTVETTTYAIEQEGKTETHIEQKVTIQSDGDPIDHDEALAQAIQEATAMNPDFTVEKIEINQTSQEEPSEAL